MGRSKTFFIKSNEKIQFYISTRNLFQPYGGVMVKALDGES